MSQSKTVRAFGVLGALVATSAFAVGCSGAPANGADEAQVKDQGASTDYYIPPINYTITYVASNSIPQNCPLYNIAGAVTLLPAHYVEKLPNTWGAAYASYGSRFTDGYSIPFPTPWITPATPTNGAPDPGTYERALYWIPSTVNWEYLVKEVTQTAPGARTYTEQSLGREYFMVPVPSINDYTAASNLAAQNTAPPVEAMVNQCVVVLTHSGTHISYTGETFLVFDEHDPRNPPT